MTDFVRRIVSGPKARHVDSKLGFDLDLVYVTDRLIIMGWPASNLEALYRNRRKDVRRFLDAKHGEKYRVYNLCPHSENNYDGDDFYGAVSRYPFPDHHPPPLSMIPMFVADLTAWLAEDAENVAAIHCKAGKGRSGTMACSYLLSLPVLPPSPQDPRNLGSKEERRQLQSSRLASTSSRSSEADGGSSAEGVSSSPSTTNLCDSDLLHPDHAQSQTPSRCNRSLPGMDQLHKQRRSSLGIDSYKVAETKAVVDERAEEVSRRLDAVFEFHTSRRLKPAKKSSSQSTSPLRSRKSSMNLKERGETGSQEAEGLGAALMRKRSLSNLVGTLGRKASRNLVEAPRAMIGDDQTGASTASLDQPGSAWNNGNRLASRSGTNLRALGASPAGRSCNDLNMPDPMPSLPSSLSRLTVNDPWASALSVVEPSGGEAADERRRPSVQFDSVAMAKSSGRGELSVQTTSFQALSPARGLPTPWVSSPHPFDSGEEGGSEEEGREEVVIPRLAVSIPSQRRWVGYWARMLADMDPRAALDHGLMHPKRRTVKITRIFIDRRAANSNSDGNKGAEGPLSVQLARYDGKLVEKLETWERTARRRKRAFGALDPRAAAPSLLPSEYDEDDKEEKSIDEALAARKKELRKQDHDRRWKDCEKRNREHAEEYDRKLRQHGNDTGVGQWGVNVLAEKDTIRAFHWDDEEVRGSQGQMETLALVRESERATLPRHLAAPMLSTADLAAKPTMGGTPGPQLMMRYVFEPGKGGKEEGEGSKPLAAATGGLTKLFQGVGLQKWTGAATDGGSRTASTGLDHLRRDQSRNTDSNASSESSGWTAPSQAITPVATAPPSPSTSEEEPHGSDCPGLVVDADRELQVKVLVGRSGTSHSKLPDVLSVGYVWLIPAFETPLLRGERKPKKGQVVQCQFGVGEIDFRKGKKSIPMMGGDVRSICVEFEWVEVGWHEEDEDTDEEG